MAIELIRSDRHKQCIFLFGFLFSYRNAVSFRWKSARIVEFTSALLGICFCISWEVNLKKEFFVVLYPSRWPINTTRTNEMYKHRSRSNCAERAKSKSTNEVVSFEHIDWTLGKCPKITTCLWPNTHGRANAAHYIDYMLMTLVRVMFDVWFGIANLIHLIWSMAACLLLRRWLLLLPIFTPCVFCFVLSLVYFFLISIHTWPADMPNASAFSFFWLSRRFFFCSFLRLEAAKGVEIDGSRRRLMFHMLLNVSFLSFCCCCWVGYCLASIGTQDKTVLTCSLAIIYVIWCNDVRLMSGSSVCVDNPDPHTDPRVMLSIILASIVVRFSASTQQYIFLLFFFIYIVFETHVARMNHSMCRLEVLKKGASLCPSFARALAQCGFVWRWLSRDC